MEDLLQGAALGGVGEHDRPQAAAPHLAALVEQVRPPAGEDPLAQLRLPQGRVAQVVPGDDPPPPPREGCRHLALAAADAADQADHRLRRQGDRVPVAGRALLRPVQHGSPPPLFVR